MRDPVRQTYTKWGGGRHWEFDTARLGEDAFGTWLGLGSGITVSRPGASFVTAVSSVTLVSDTLCSTPTFHATWDAEPGEVAFEIYVDITTRAIWSTPDQVTMVDLDLDVVRYPGGRIEVLDEDEFAEHQVSFAYPADVIDLARRSCDEVVDAMTRRVEPYATVGWDWLRQA